jgi:hypothetical protein
MTESPRHPWEQMPGETPKAFGKFRAYRDMGAERSLAKLGQMHGGEKGWSLAGLEDRIRREAQIDAIREMAERQARDGLDMQKLARNAMRKWLKEDPETGQLILASTLRPAEVARLYRLGFEVERLARGEPIQVTQDKKSAEETYDEDRLAIGIAFALAQAGPDPAGVGGGGEENRLPAPTETEPGAVDGGAALDSRQAEPDGPAAPESDPEEAGA